MKSKVSVFSLKKNLRQPTEELAQIQQFNLYPHTISTSDDVSEQFDLTKLQTGMFVQDKQTKKKLCFLAFNDTNDLILYDEEANEIVWYNQKDVEPA